MEREVEKNENLESFKLESLKLESFTEVGKFRCSWKVLAEVGKFKDTLTVLFLARLTK